MELRSGRRALLIYWITIFLCGTIILYGNIFKMDYLTVRFNKPLLKQGSKENNFTIDTPGCKIPYLDAFDKNIRKYTEKYSKPICDVSSPLVASNLTSIFVLPSSFPLYHIEDLRYLECCYQPFWRIEPEKGEEDTKIEFDNTCYPFIDDIDIQDEFIKVTCQYNSTNIYVDTFSFVPLKNGMKFQADPDRLNVLVLGLDTVSRLNLHRQMPKTVKYLANLGGVELMGYNKVGDNTFPNLIPVLTGLTEDELINNCWPHPNDNFDNCSFVWNLYKEKGHITAYGEDCAWMGLFNYERKGFKKQNTDFNYAVFNRMSEGLIGNSKEEDCNQCIGSRLVYKELLDYMKKFVITMDTNRLPYFGFFWEVTILHEYLNSPQVCDDDYHLLLKTLLEGNHLNNTVLVFMSDHGIRWGDIRETFQGKMEERLPFVFFLFPDWFQRKYSKAYENLKINTKRLTTPFDLYETLVVLVNPNDLLVDYNLKNTNLLDRGISLFKPISDERTCEDAGITDNWCTCTESMDIEINNKVLDAAKSAVDNINFQLEGYTQCAKLTLDTVIDAKLVWNPSVKKNTSLDYSLTLRTLPSQAVFEVTMSNLRNDSFEVIGSISRLNLYGDQSSCITDFHLKLYCYCVSLLG